MTVLAFLTAAPAVVAGALAAHAAVNARLLRRPVPPTSTVDTAVSVLLPVRDEASRVRPCVAALLAQQYLSTVEFLVLDDGSIDGTAEAVREAAAGDARLRLLDGAPLPPGWLGKPYACQQLAGAAAGEVLVFVDADTLLTPKAVAAAIGLLRGFDLVTPYPRIVARTAGERLVQPLLQWSWLTFVPLRALERGARPSLAVAGGQFLVVRAQAYHRVGGHAAVRGSVLEDVSLAREVIRGGGRVSVADGSAIASCRMYSSWRELADGYAKSLWAAFGSAAAATATVAVLLCAYALPPLLAAIGVLVGDGAAVAAGLAGYAAGVAGRVVTARATGGRAFPDALAQPASIVAFAALVARSFRLRRRGALRWKGRPV
jgi:hypothetical protein